ncbi:ADP-ribosyltransferase [Aeromonas caviae]|uniref:ADP-ribosyltransferase n=1 Tax=Aeromonas caviae TaxID=648 RepID=UPI002B468219|nr:ADP-ribosyltransferase [Aeromonas caviae]
MEEQKEVLTPIIDAKLKSDLYTRLSADDSCGHCVSSLSEDEAAAVYFYTTENDHLSYKVVNPYLRGECHDINLSNHISWIDSALQKLPNYTEGPLYRGEDSSGSWLDLINKINARKKISAKDLAYYECGFYMSSTIRKNSPFLYKNVILNITTSNSGRLISHVSAFPEESEVLFQRDSKFIVVGVDNESCQGKLIIHLTGVNI